MKELTLISFRLSIGKSRETGVRFPVEEYLFFFFFSREMGVRFPVEEHIFFFFFLFYFFFILSFLSAAGLAGNSTGLFGLGGWSIL